MKTLVWLGMSIGVLAAYGQPSERLSFDVASIKPSFARGIQNVRALPGRLSADATTQVLLQYAYGVQAFQVTGAPDWMQSERYQIEATADGNPDASRLFLMLRSLLESRFQLKTHREMKELPVYALVVAKGGLKLPAPKADGCVESAADASAEWAGGRMAAPGEVPSAKPRCGSVGVALGRAGARLQGEKVVMAELAKRLSLLLARSVVDRTEFAGAFSLQMDFVPDQTTPGMPPPPPDAGISGLYLEQALRQLGLQLESVRAPVEIIVVDHVERPSGN